MTLTISLSTIAADCFRTFDRLVKHVEHGPGWINRAKFCGKTILVSTFLTGSYSYESYVSVSRIGLVTVMVYTLLVLQFYLRDKARPRRAPGLRLRYFFLKPAGDCLICHNEVSNPILLKCGHLYCAECLMPAIEEKINRCAYCFQIPTSGDNLRLERLQIGQLALDVTVLMLFALKVRIGGWAGFRSCGNCENIAPARVLLYFVKRWLRGLDWWKPGDGINVDRAARRERWEAQVEDLRWMEEVRDQLEDGLAWYYLLSYWLLFQSWWCLRREMSRA